MGSSPETDGRTGQIARPASHTVQRKLAGWEAWESPEHVWSHSPSVKPYVFKGALLAG